MFRYLLLRCLLWSSLGYLALSQLRLPTGDLAQAAIVLACATFLLGRDLGVALGGQS